MTVPVVSLFVTTYELPRHLALVCAALERQTDRRFEVLFCDDGSSAETARVIEDFKNRSGLEVRHLWQEHQGFRKCRILNAAVRQSKGSVFIFLDGDCVPHRDFIRDHLAQQEPGRYLAGRRVELGRRLSEMLTPELVAGGFFDFPRWALLKSAFQGETEAINRSFRVSSAFLRQLFKMNRVVDMKGCNYSVSREAIEVINGFDESYEGYGREDTDVEIRLQNLGLKIKSMKGLAIQFHVWHPRREFTPANDDRLDEVRRSGRYRCEKGLN
jgi:cellulose synthase/poly-beta-1,6-N-acetylglucosamine synthase-like glycosyltransferase